MATIAERLGFVTAAEADRAEMDYAWQHKYPRRDIGLPAETTVDRALREAGVCPAVRRPTTKTTRERRVREAVVDSLGYEFTITRVERESEAAVEVIGAHPTKCGRKT